MAILFARLQADVPLKMRRGAWYRVIQLTDLQAVIEVNHRKVGVLRAWLEIQQRPPQRWSVVHGSAENKKAPPHLRGTYGVCPNWSSRSIGRKGTASNIPRDNGHFQVGLRALLFSPLDARA